MKAGKSTKPFAKKSFGQNFLVDQNYISKIISALNIQPDETIVEIGAGRGALTERLIEAGASVVAVELERDMIAVLKDKFADQENFTLIESDALKVDFQKISDFRFQISNSENQNLKSKIRNSKLKLVANLPYYISTAILQKLIVQREVFSEMILMFQREVVERIAAEAGTKERGFLTVLTEAYLTAEKLFDVPPNAFFPAPKVWSAVVRLTPKEKVGIENEELFRDLLSFAFAQKRKTILNNLKNAGENLTDKNLEEILSNSKIDARRRAETLTIDEWRKLTDNLSR